MDKELRKIVKALEEQGFECKITRRGHVAVTRKGEWVVTVHSSGDWRALRNALAALRRGGFQWPPE